MEVAIMNLAKLSEKKVMETGEQVSIIFEGREITNMEMLQKSKKLATALKNLGVKRGDRVILQMPNCPEVLQGFGAIWRIGAVIVPINYLIGEEETAYIYRDSGVKVVISSQAFLPKIRAGQTKAPGVKTIILVDKDVPEGTLAYHPLVESSVEEHSAVDTRDDEIAALFFVISYSSIYLAENFIVDINSSSYEHIFLPYMCLYIIRFCGWFC